MKQQNRNDHLVLHKLSRTLADAIDEMDGDGLDTVAIMSGTTAFIASVVLTMRDILDISTDTIGATMCEAIQISVKMMEEGEFDAEEPGTGSSNSDE